MVQHMLLILIVPPLLLFGLDGGMMEKLRGRAAVRLSERSLGQRMDRLAGG